MGKTTKSMRLFVQSANEREFEVATKGRAARTRKLASFLDSYVVAQKSYVKRLEILKSA
jgi:hypothetical protein